ncbi:ATP-binding protein [Sphingomonas sp. RHCKR7]|uniref:ATP-binding protein n=1 Tax=Sphingomonas folli TaxID=2862497 RepID=UPI001CA49272|nr:ATP-binding protein [Sphingomonas folli]MBW6528519.1 ATP-binding protein [Sphingomonas folli]
MSGAPIARSSFALVSDDALLLHEFSHRVANQLAAGMATLQLVKAAPPGGRLHLIDRAIGQFAAFGEVHRLLARPVRPMVDVAKDLTTVCGAVAAASSNGEKSVVTLRAAETWVAGNVARRLLLVAVEVVANAVRHALEGRAGRLAITLDVTGEDVVLTVEDDGPGIVAGAASSGTGLGSGIVVQLVERAGGSIGIESGPSGTLVKVSLPLRTGPDPEDWVGF